MFQQVLLAAVNPPASTASASKTKEKGDTGQIYRWDLGSASSLGFTYKEVYSEGDTSQPISLFPSNISLETAHFVSLNTRNSSLNYYSIDKERPLYRFYGQDKLSVLQMSPCGGILAAGNRDGKIFIWDVKSGNLLSVLDDAHLQTVSSLVYTRDGEYLLSGSWDGSVKVWSVLSLYSPSNKKPLFTLDCQTDKVTDIQIGFGLGRNARVYVSSQDSKVRMYDLLNGNLLATFEFPTSITRLACNSTETLLFCGSDNGALFLIDLGEEIRDDPLNILGRESQISASLEGGHSATITALCFSLDETNLISADANGNINIWLTSNRQLLRKLTVEGRVTWLQVITKSSYEVNSEKGEKLTVCQPSRTVADISLWSQVGTGDNVVDKVGCFSGKEENNELIETYSRLLDYVFAKHTSM